jgi:hypothetical protein
MKKLILLALVLCASFMSLDAQWSGYMTAGISPESNPVNAPLIVNRHNPTEEFLFNMVQVKTQYFLGIQVRYDLGTNFFVGTGATYTQRKSIYSMQYILRREKGTYQELQEIEDQIILPLSIGVKLKSFEITSGLLGFVSLAKQTELNQMDGFSDQSDKVQMGWHAGAGINLNKVFFGIEYQSAMNRTGMGKSVHQQSLELMNVPGQCVFNIRYKF